jgi:hypothetical protein
MLVSMSSDRSWRESLDRLGAANARKDRERLASLTLEESGRLFEELCRIFHAEFEVPPRPREKRAALSKYWKKP